MLIVIISECLQLPGQVDYIPEEHAIEIFTANGADQFFDERMRNRDVQNRLDLFDLEYAQVGEPTMKTKQRIVVGADVFRQRLTGDGVIEHSTNRAPIYKCTFDAETDEPAREYVHDQHHPMTAQEDRFAAEHVDAPDAVVYVADECEPGWAIGSAVDWPVVLREHAAHDIFVDVDAEGMRDLLGDAYTAEFGIAALRLDDRRDEFRGRAFWTGFAPRRRHSRA